MSMWDNMGVYKRNNVVRKKCIQYLGEVMVK